MRDCLNVEIREMLPEQAAGSLQGESARRVTEHLGECVDCVEELTVLRSARSVLLRAPAVDVSRIAAGVTAATRARAAAPVRAPRRWVGLRAAAALLVVAAGATSVALWNDGADTGGRTPAAVVAQAEPSGEHGLALTGGFADLSDAEIETLMNDIDDLDADYVVEPEATLPSLAIGELGGA
jgi:hypothetical protein